MTYTANGTSFTMLKFRTVVVGAQTMLTSLLDRSTRTRPPAKSSLDQQRTPSSVDHARPLNAITTPEIAAPSLEA